jgi:hypothetical protein
METTFNVKEFLQLQNPTEDDYTKLVSGNDDYSCLNYNWLIREVDVSTRVKIPEMEEEYECKVMRWILRGLPVEQAVTKVEIDKKIWGKYKKKKTL